MAALMPCQCTFCTVLMLWWGYLHVKAVIMKNNLLTPDSKLRRVNKWRGSCSSHFFFFNKWKRFVWELG